MRRALLAVVVALAATLSLTGARVFAQQDTIKIGVIQPLSGPVAASASTPVARSAWPLGTVSRSRTRKRVQALWNGAGVLASPNP